MGVSFDFLNSRVKTDILKFLADNSGKSGNEKDINLVKRIISGTGYSRKGVHDALLELTGVDLITYRQIGKSKVYEINNDSRVIKQFKVLKTVIELNPLSEKLEESTKKIILYGSAARGEDRPESDIDLGILADTLDHDRIKDEISRFKSKKKINAELFTPVKFMELEKKDRVYYMEIDRGIILWEEKGE